MPLANGARFAGYTILRPLGTGGMGEVYLAQHPRLPRRDALKILPTEWSADPDFRSRFGREADLASTLWHPNIVGVHDRGEWDGQLWISMDFIDGLDLGHLLARRYPTGMPPRQVSPIVTAVADALDYAHRQGLLHRDVKPANIMLATADGGAQRVVLTDFGIARNLDDISGLTATNMTVGTVAYCAPEQLMGKALDGRADQYALAATAYQLLTGTQPFPFSNPAVVISHHLNVAPPPLADTRTELAELDPALRRALAKDPGDRYGSCTEFARALAGESTGPALVSPSAPTRAAPAFRPVDESGKHSATPRSRTRLITGVVAAAVLLIAGVVLMWRPWPSPEAAPDALTSPSAAPLPASTTTNSSTSPPAPPPPPPPSEAPTSTTTTAATTTTVVTGATLGVACTDHDRIAVDPATGQEIVCLERFGPSYGWFWREAGTTEGIHERNTSCVGQRAWSSSRTPDGYMITCQPDDIISSDPVAGPGSQWRRPANI